MPLWTSGPPWRTGHRGHTWAERSVRDAHDDVHNMGNVAKVCVGLNGVTVDSVDNTGDKHGR